MCKHHSIAHLPTHYPVTCHTDYVDAGSTFVAIAGANHNGLAFVPLAIEKGATKIVVQKSVIIPDTLRALLNQKQIALEYVDDTRKALAQLSAEAAEYPAEKLKIIGITGTKGKTTTTFLLYHILQTAGYKTAMLSTVQNEIDGGILPAQLTTPQPDYLHQFLKVCVEEEVEYVVMEVAAQATSLYRTHGIQFDAAIFTNLSQEHGEFYPSMEDYFAAKCALFDQLKLHGTMLINSDDTWGKKLLAQHPTAQTFGLETAAKFTAELSDASRAFITAAIKWGKNSLPITCPTLIGNYNLLNILAAAGCALQLGVNSRKIARALETFESIPGRLERYFLNNGATCIIDYAHNPSSYTALFSTLRPLTNHLILVFGCGGQRDAARRPIMGAIAAEYADVIILTSDNPRTENPADIIADIMAGIPEHNRANVRQILDRRAAIEHAYELSGQGSIFVLLGKGPDEYQIIGDTKTYFSEVAILNTLE
ncbi:MAG TPA: UDP-N-acetylmuramoyl-L-alanyl-D-glutamate--2,6-diaminopimelate ligase [Candidatus Babeliales bacterium]|nr:UDP-N-acetylmuramoyl-L-alanyl-D-glutamate--2,6-diaminopimelate ligase [Candidatus Babeliales bacterium]